MHTRLIRLPELTSQLGIGKTKLYSMIKAGEFPQPVKIGKISAWPSEVVSGWIETKVVAIQQRID